MWPSVLVRQHFFQLFERVPRGVEAGVNRNLQNGFADFLDGRPVSMRHLQVELHRVDAT